MKNNKYIDKLISKKGIMENNRVTRHALTSDTYEVYNFVNIVTEVDDSSRILNFNEIEELIKVPFFGKSNLEKQIKNAMILMNISDDSPECVKEEFRRVVNVIKLSVVTGRTKYIVNLNGMSSQAIRLITRAVALASDNSIIEALYIPNPFLMFPVDIKNPEVQLKKIDTIIYLIDEYIIPDEETLGRVYLSNMLNRTVFGELNLENIEKDWDILYNENRYYDNSRAIEKEYPGFIMFDTLKDKERIYNKSWVKVITKESELTQSNIVEWYKDASSNVLIIDVSCLGDREFPQIVINTINNLRDYNGRGVIYFTGMHPSLGKIRYSTNALAVCLAGELKVSTLIDYDNISYINYLDTETKHDKQTIRDLIRCDRLECIDIPKVLIENDETFSPELEYDLNELEDKKTVNKMLDKTNLFG